MIKKPVLLIVLHNTKALGVGYLEKALNNAGYPVSIVFFKSFNSVNPNPATQTEINLLKDLIKKINPGLIGMSVMSSLYLETVYSVNNMLKQSFDIPVVWGGVYPTLFPERCLEHTDYVLRGEGENPIVELCDQLFNNGSLDSVDGLSYKKDGSVHVNECASLCEDLDKLGFPEIGGDNRYLINDDKIHHHDPAISAVSFELSASRGCPFSCSYCCVASLHKVQKGKGKYVRFRSASSVIEELKQAKAKVKNLKFIHFWDEIFSTEEEWLNEFTERYKKEIGLPFDIWAHPLKVSKNLIQKLVDAGLYQVVMGIQSGSPRVRKEIFHRAERQEDIIKASEIFVECGVPRIIYDFILRHPFENEDDLKETYELCTKLKPPFELQLHGLNFFPGIAIADMAVEKNIISREELEKVMYGPMQTQYKTYWGHKHENPMFNFWYSLTFMTQFGVTRPIARFYANRHKSKFIVGAANCSYKLLVPMRKLKHYYRKAKVVFRPKKR